MEPAVIAPPPWSLTGEGLVVLYHIPERFNRQYGFMPGYQQAGYKGWVGAMVLADYKTSGVGPYQELIYIPGLFRIGGKLTFSIPKIYVSTFDSLWNGRQNWGISKELAEFHVVKQADGTQVYIAGVAGKPFFELRVKAWGLPLPFTTKLIPFTRLTQQFQNQLLLKRPVASGSVRLAAVKYLSVDSDFFPPLQLLRPFLALSLSDFRMTFPLPEVLSE